MTDPYEQQRQACLEKNGEHTQVKGHNTCCSDDNVSVHHPVQPKTQVEKWWEEIEENWNIVFAHQDDCSDCKKRLNKINELNDLISKDHEEKGRFIGRTPSN